MPSYDLDRPKKASLLKVRFLVAVMGLLCPVVCYMSRQNLSIAMVAMFNDDKGSSQPTPGDQNISNDTHTTSERLKESCPAPVILNEHEKVISYGPKYDWKLVDRNRVLESFFWTYVACQIPAGRLSEIVGTRWILATATIGSSILSLIAPMAASLDVYSFAITRAVLGLCQTALYPACYSLITRWLPPSERSLALSILGFSAYIGSIIASSTTGYFIQAKSFGWEYAFYLPGVVCGIWAVIWLLFCDSDPRSHRFISIEEVEYIESKMEVKTKGLNARSPSWGKIFKSRHVWMMVVSFFSSNWSFSIVFLLIPTYLNYVLNVPPIKNGIINSIIYTLFCISSTVVGYLSTYMVETKAFGMSKLAVRKLFQGIAIFSQAIVFVALPLVGCDSNLAIGLLYLQVVLFSCVNGGEVHLAAEISLEYAGTIYAIGNCIGSSTGFIIPRIHSILVDDNTNREQWSVYFNVAAAVTATGGAIFMLFGKNDRQDFSKNLSESRFDIYNTEDGNTIPIPDLGQMNEKNKIFNHVKSYHNTIVPQPTEPKPSDDRTTPEIQGSQIVL